MAADGVYPSQRAFHNKKIHQTPFIASEVKPYNKQVSAKMVKSASPPDCAAGAPASATPGPIELSTAEDTHEAQNQESLLSPVSATSPASRTRLNSVPQSPALRGCTGPQINFEMSRTQRVQALDWRIFGQRNHITIVRKEGFDLQFPFADAAKYRMHRPAASTNACVSLRELAKSKLRPHSGTVVARESSSRFVRKHSVMH